MFQSNSNPNLPFLRDSFRETSKTKKQKLQETEVSEEDGEDDSGMDVGALNCYFSDPLCVERMNMCLFYRIPAIHIPVLPHLRQEMVPNRN